MRKTFTVVLASLFGMALGVAALVGWQWHGYVTRGDTPYDEIGIELNSRMPRQLREWGCARIAERFPGSLPPYGCQAPSEPG